MSQKISIDLKKNPEVADVVADMEPGATVKIMGTIVSRDDQTLVVRISEVTEVGAPDESPETEEEESEESEEPKESIASIMDDE